MRMKKQRLDRSIDQSVNQSNMLTQLKSALTRKRCDSLREKGLKSSKHLNILKLQLMYTGLHKAQSALS